jgi:hypothetical protein
MIQTLKIMMTSVALQLVLMILMLGSIDGKVFAQESEPEKIIFMQAIPTSKSAKASLHRRIGYKKQKLVEHQKYLQKLMQRFDSVKEKYKSEESQRTRSAIAMRIVRQMCQIESDKFKIWVDEEIQKISDMGIKSEEDPRFNEYFKKRHKKKKIETLYVVKSIFETMDKEIIEKHSRKSFIELRENLE